MDNGDKTQIQAPAGPGPSPATTLEGLLIFALARDGGSLSEADSRPQYHVTGLRNRHGSDCTQERSTRAFLARPVSLAEPGVFPSLTGVSWGREAPGMPLPPARISVPPGCAERRQNLLLLSEGLLLTTGELPAKYACYPISSSSLLNAAVTLKSEAVSERMTEMPSICCQNNTEESIYLFG